MTTAALRTRAMARVLMIVGLVAALVPRDAWAQNPPTFQELVSRLEAGDRVTVASADGHTSRGRLVQITPERLVLRVEAREITFMPANVRQVRVCCDSPLNGTLIGLGGGAVFGALIARGFSDHPDLADSVQGALMFGAVGAGFGLCLDAIIRRDVTVYRGSALTVGLAADPAGRRLRFFARW